MSCWTCESCGQKWCDLDDCPMCGELEPSEDFSWEGQHLHEIVNRREPEHYEKSTA